MANALQNSITVMAVVTDFHRASDLISLENRGALFDFFAIISQPITRVNTVAIKT